MNRSRSTSTAVAIFALSPFVLFCGSGGGGGGGTAGLPPATSPPPSGARVSAPFYVGAWVEADPFAWGDLRGMGADSASTVEAICADLQDMGCNVVWVAGFAGFYDGEATYGRLGLIRMWLDAAERHGLKVVLQGSGLPYAIPKEDPNMRQVTRDVVIPTWIEIAARFRPHAALLAYCPVEEIADFVDQSTPTLDALAEVGRAVWEIDPLHPVTTIHIAMWYDVAEAEARLRGENMKVEVADLYVFTHVTDWSEPGYAFATSAEETQAYLAWAGRHADLARSLGIPQWMFAQANETTWVRRLGGLSSPRESRPNFRMPTPAEMRFQVWASILSGSRGVFFFPYTSTPDYSPEIQATLVDWEYGTGMRTLDGQPTQSHQGLRQAGTRVRPHLALLGRLVPEAAAILDGFLAGRLMRDPETGTRYVVLLNRDVAAAAAGRPAAVPAAVGAAPLIDLFTGRSLTRETISSVILEPGDGTLLRVGP